MILSFMMMTIVMASLPLEGCGKKSDVYISGCYQGVSDVYRHTLKDKYTDKMEPLIIKFCKIEAELYLQ